MSFKIFGALPLLFLAACAQFPAKTDVTTSNQSNKTGVGQSKLPDQELTPPMLFDFLLGETAFQRGDPEIATHTYLKLARTTRDPRVAQRATEIALQSRQPLPALEAANIWATLDPNSVGRWQRYWLTLTGWTKPGPIWRNCWPLAEAISMRLLCS